MDVSIIVAKSRNHAIGLNNQMPWHISADLKRFKEITTGHFVVMGRNTYESIGKPLPNRTNIVITRNKSYQAPGCLVMHSIDQALFHAKQHHESEVFIIGGSQLYKEALEFADIIYLTEIDADFEGDVFFPEIDFSQWHLVTKETFHAQQTGQPFSYSFITLERW